MEENPKISAAVRAVMKAAKPADIRPQDEIKRRLNDIAAAVNERLPDGYAFILLASPVGPNGILNYVSSMERSDAINVMKEFLIKCGAAEDWMQNIR